MLKLLDASGYLGTESVQSSALSLESIDNVHGSDGLSLGMLSVGDCISNDVLQEDLEDAASFLVDQAGNTLDTAASSQSTDRWLRDALNVVAQDFPVTLGTTFSETLAAFTSSRHDELLVRFEEDLKY